MLKKLFQNFNPEALKKYALNTSWLLFEKLTRIVVGLVVGIWFVAKYLGAERFGQLDYARSFVMLFSAFAALGLHEIITRELVKFPEKTNKILGTSLVLRLAGASLIFLLINALSFVFSFENFISSFLGISQSKEDMYLILVSSLMLFFTSFDVINFYFQAKVKSKFVVQVTIVAMILGAISKLVAIYLQLDLIYFAVLISMEFLLMALGLLWIAKKEKLHFFDWKFDKKIALGLLKDSYPLMLSSAMVVLYMRTDQVMIKQMLGDFENGNYAMALRLSESWYFVPVIISASVFPAIINAKKKSKYLYSKRLQQLFDMLVLIGLVVAIATNLVADELMLFIDENFSGGASVLKIHIWGGILVALGVSSGKWLLIENLTKIALWRTILGAILNIMLNWYLIPIYGINGAAWATVFSTLSVAYLFDLFHSKTRVIFIMKTKSLTGISLIQQAWKFVNN